MVKHTKEKFILEIRDGTCKFAYNSMEIPHIGRYSGLIWNNFGFMEVDAQAVFLLCTSDQLESDNSHKHALRLTNIECKHE